jgi:hypothetical protein
MLVVGGSARPDVGEEGAPRVRKTAADALEVKAVTLRWVEQPLGGFVQREPAGRRLLKHASAHQVPEHPTQGIGVAACRRGKAIDLSGARRDVVSFPRLPHTPPNTTLKAPLKAAATWERWL